MDVILHVIALDYMAPMQGRWQENTDAYYGDALEASMSFYAAQRSGTLGVSIFPWRGDSGLNDVPTGGFYLGSSE